MRNKKVTQTATCLLLTAVFSVPAMAFVCPVNTNTVTFLGTDTTTQGAWKGAGNFNAPPASSSLVYGRDGDILPDTESCDLSCNPVPSYVSPESAMHQLEHARQHGGQGEHDSRVCESCAGLGQCYGRGTTERDQYELLPVQLLR